MPTIRISYEKQRGCGYRKPGGLYLVSGKLSIPCCKLPKEMSVCPCCGQGIKPARGWTWVNPQKIFEKDICKEYHNNNNNCILFEKNIPSKAGLLWIGEKYYPTPEEFCKEGTLMGISRRIHNIPQKFKIGETLVLLGHRKTVIKEKEVPAIFSAFIPTAIEYVVKPNDNEEKLTNLKKRGISVVDVRPFQMSFL